MTIKKCLRGYCQLAVLMASIFFFTSVLSAQIPTIDSLRLNIKTKEDSLKQLGQNYEQIKKSFDALNAKIFRQKQELEKSSNPLINLKLKANLKESAILATKLEKLQKQKQHLRLELKNMYRQIITGIDSLLQQKIRLIQKQQNSHSQIAALNSIDLLEKEKKIWQQKIIELRPDLTELPSLEIEPNDNIERLQLKIQILQDRIRQVKNELKKLHKRRAELQADVQIYEEMLSFMDNLQQNIDLEQEYFDQERSDQIKNDMRNTKLKLSGIDERVIKLTRQKTEMENKLQQFKKYLMKKLNQ